MNAHFPQDIQRARPWAPIERWGGTSNRLVYLHECGGITRVDISDNAIRYYEPGYWLSPGDISHFYCRGC